MKNAFCIVSVIVKVNIETLFEHLLCKITIGVFTVLIFDALFVHFRRQKPK